jgi:hypothetical protein
LRFRTAGILLALGFAVPSSAMAETKNTIALCWSNGKRLDCTAGSSEKRATDYCRSQCRGWSATETEKAACREVWRCTSAGFSGATVPFKGGSPTFVCALPTKDAAKEKLSAACGTDCRREIFELTPPLEAELDEIPMEMIQRALTKGRTTARRQILAILALRKMLPKVPARALTPLARFVRSIVTFRDKLAELERQIDVSKDVRRELVNALREFEASEEGLEASWKVLQDDKDSTVWRARFEAAYRSSSTNPESDAEARRHFDAWVKENVER